MHNQKNRPPFVFVNFRKLKDNNRIIAVFIQTYDQHTDQITIFDIDHHENVDRHFILFQTQVAKRIECDKFLNQLRSDYEIIADQQSCIIRCVPYLPFSM